MMCLHPFHPPKAKEGVFVPCGNCMHCRVSKSRELAIRCLHELGSWDNKALFVTLTYRSQELIRTSDGATLDKDELQLFFKRLRKLRAPARLKYLACGEYGGDKGRPHYHMILFGFSKLDDCEFHQRHGRWRCELIEKAWPYGHVDIADVSYQSCRYVAGYLHKKDNDYPSDFGLRQRPFRVMSQGLGLGYVYGHFEQLWENRYIQFEGKRISLPRYYVNKLNFGMFDFMDESVTDMNKVSNFVKDADARKRSGVVSAAVQHDRNLRAKDNLRKRDFDVDSDV